MTDEKQPTTVHFNAWAALYLLMALFWLYMSYTELTGKWLTEPGDGQVVEAQRVPVETESATPAKEEAPSGGID